MRRWSGRARSSTRSGEGFRSGVRAPVPAEGLAELAADRGRPRGGHPLPPRRGAHLHPHLPRQAGLGPAGGDPHGEGKRGTGVLCGGGPAGQGPLRDRGRASDLEYGLQCLQKGWLSSQQIEAGRVAATHFLHGEGRIFIRIFPDKPVSAQPAETRMGKGKGEPEYYAAVVRPGKVLYEIGGGLPIWSTGSSACRRAG